MAKGKENDAESLNMLHSDNNFVGTSVFVMVSIQSY